MKSGIISYGCPEWSLTQAALAQMRDEIYGLPVWAYAGATDSKTMDAQAGAESMFSIATSMLSRCNLIHDVGYIEYGNTSCLEMVTMGNELVEMCKFFVQGILVNEDTLAIDAIRRVGTGESGEIFLSDEHTFKHFITAQFLPKLLNRSYYDEWKRKVRLICISAAILRRNVFWLNTRFNRSLWMYSIKSRRLLRYKK